MSFSETDATSTARPDIVLHRKDDDAPRVVAPQRATLFAERAQRFAELAAGHALGDWLRLLGRLSQAQHDALQALPAPRLPDAPSLEQAYQHGMPPVLAQHGARDASWQEALRHIVGQLQNDAPANVQAHCRQLAATAPQALAALADRILSGAPASADEAALSPYVAAALQVRWTALAAELGAVRLPLLDVHGICPCCGSLPVASVVRTAPEVNNLRYLHCSLCNTEWHMVRVKCSVCEATGKVSYRQLEGSPLPNAGAMRAEVCDDCHSYLKILYQEKALAGDPVADDLATLALDILVDEAGYARAGPNLLFVAGDT